MKFVALLLALVVAANARKPDKYMPQSDRQKRLSHGPCPDVSMFRCDNGLCIQAEWVCDTDNDCLDYSDEDGNCTHNCQGPNKFICQNQACIPREYRCDGKDDCDDGSDEDRCDLVTCPPGEMKCHNQVCIEDMWRCNGEDDCGDNTDEQNCVTCRSGFFRCATESQCIRQPYVCDGDFDCRDKSDEANCDHHH
ncbi:uncharacterized protein LOC143288586 [Babylonia areolata]|uniref:uncharacterized protein LOC143288586 n=1 Tax=Babylonia areolata TaxID=304850 RepID=UPI003FD68AA3